MTYKAASNGSRPRVVVAGVGAITAMGPTATDLWSGVREARVAIQRVRQMPMEGFGTRVGAEVDDEFVPHHDYRRPEGYREPAIDFALIAAEEALGQAAVGFDDVPAERWALVLGTCNAGMESAEMWHLQDIAWETKEPGLLEMVPPQAIAEAVAGAFGIKGPCLSINTACAAGANAIGWAAELIASGEADAALTGGSDALSQIAFGGFTALESLSPTSAAPYSRNRQGLSLGEGSGMLVLLRADVAQRLGLRPLAEVRGYGLSADGYHPTAPHPEGEGAARAIRAALAAGGLEAGRVNYINGHGTGTPKNDSAETNAIIAALGPAADQVLVSSTKSMIGHLLGAAGAVEAIVTIEALEHQVAPPTANFEEEDPDCPLDYVPNRAREARIEVALSNNFAFGGNNACLALARPGAIAEAPPEPAFDRVVLTGIGLVTCAGSDPAAVLAALEGAGSPGAGVNRTRRAEFDPAAFLTPREMRRMDRISVMSVVATKLALADATITIDETTRVRTGLIYSTGIGPMETLEQFTRPLFSEGPGAANPAIFPNTVYNAAAGQVGIHTGVVGPTSTVTAGNAAGAAAISYGASIAAEDRADSMVCLGADALTDTLVRAYRELGVFHHNPAYALSEGAAAVVVERLGHARGRSARIYGEVLGHAIACDAAGIDRIDPRGQGVERALRLALERAGLQAGDVAEVWSAASGLRAADTAEAEALRRVLGGREVRTFRPRLALGDPLGAGGTLSTALALTRAAASAGAPRPALILSSTAGGTHVALAVSLGWA